MNCLDKECLAPMACQVFGYCRQLNFPQDTMDLLADPNAVHINLLRGTIAKPSIKQIIHIYGREALLEELSA